MQITEFSRELLTFHAGTLSLGLIVASRFVSRLPIRHTFKTALAVLVVMVSLRYLVSQLLSGSTDTIELPRPFIIAINGLFASVLFLALFQIALDVFSIVRSLVLRRRVRSAPWMRWTIGAFALMLSTYGVAQALRTPPVKTVDIAIDGLPVEFEGYRILQLSDLHTSRLFDKAWIAKAVGIANAQEADLIVVSGDLVEGTLEARREDVDPLRLLRAPDGVYMAPGNHEYYFDYEGWMERFRELDLRILANAHSVIRRQEAALVLAGLTDVTALALGLPGPDLRKALAGAPAGAPVVLLDHQPRLARLAADAGVDLQLSGHTHGGMMVGFRRLVASVNNGFVSGLYDVQGMSLYVSNGTALASGFAVRVGVPSEMTVLVLRAR